MAYSINLTDAQKTEVTKLIAESASTDDTITTWINEYLNTVLETSMRDRLHEYIASDWPDRGEKQETLKALDPADMETEYAEYFPSE